MRGVLCCGGAWGFGGAFAFFGVSGGCSDGVRWRVLVLVRREG